MINDFLDKLLTATAWPMTPPKAYGAFHLLFFFIGLAACILLAHSLRNLGEKGCRRVLFGVGVFLAVCELYKQLFYFYYVGNNAYQWWIFPFQLCSIPIYFCLIAPLLKKGPVQQCMYDFMIFYNLLGGFIAFFEPSGLIHQYWTLTLHAFIWHMVLVFVGLFLVFTRQGEVSPHGYRRASVAFVSLCGIAFMINLIFRQVSGGSINMFYVGPSNSPIIIFKTISEKYGWYASTVLYVPIFCFGAFLVYLFLRLLTHKKAFAKPVTETVNKLSPAK